MKSLREYLDNQSFEQENFKGRLKDSKMGIIVIGKNESANVSKVL